MDSFLKSYKIFFVRFDGVLTQGAVGKGYLHLCKQQMPTAGSLHNFCLDKGVRWCVESEGCPGTRQVMGGFTAKGGVAVITNQLGVVAKTLISARSELATARPSVFLVNGMLASAATGLQTVLDAIASLCHHLQPDSEHTGPVYFSTYQFNVTTWDFIATIKRNDIAPLRFGPNSFNDVANGLKHELPWIGLISEVDDKQDVYDDAGVGMFRGLLVPMYNISKKIVQRIGRTTFPDQHTSDLQHINQPVDLPIL